MFAFTFARLAATLLRRPVRPSSPAVRQATREKQYFLERMLTVHATDRATGRKLVLVSDRMGPCRMHFRCGQRLPTGATLDLEMLLTIDTPVRLFATVSSVIETPRGCVGELTIQTDAPSRTRLEAYLSRLQRPM